MYLHVCSPVSDCSTVDQLLGLVSGCIFTSSSWLRQGVGSMSVVGCLCTVILTAHRRGTGLYFMNITLQGGQRQEGEKQVESAVGTRK